MKVTANYPTYVEVDGQQRLIEAGETVDVDGRKYSAEHLDIKHGNLTAEQDEKPKRGRKQEPKQDTDEQQEAHEGEE